jgi:TonB-dependent starch-binding outer membrane protein SusC
MKKNIQRQLIMFSKRLLYGFIIQLFFCTVLIANDSNAQRKTIENVKIKIALKDKPVSLAFDLIESNTDFRFTYNDNMIDFNQSVTIAEANQSVYKVLEEISKQTQMSFVQVNDNIHVNAKKRRKDEQSIQIAEGYEVMVRGTVKDIKNDPLPGVSIIIEGTSIGTVTDLDGNFALEVPEGSVLVFSFIGFERQRIAIDNQTNLDIVLKEDARSLQEVVVIGYGTVKRSDFTGSIAQVKEEDIKATPIVAIDRALQGRAAGVSVTQNSARPGGGTTIRIRGTGSVTAGNEPLYVIDGYPIGDLNTINPMDVESIEILKDASATAIYGSRGSNGVIIVTTKRGKDGQSSVDFESYYGVQNVRRKIPLLNSREYAEFINEARVNGGGVPYFDGSSAERPLPANVPNDTDWQNEVFQAAPIQNYQLSITGGNERTKYAISGNLFDQQGLILNSFFKRYSVRTNLDHNISSKIKVGLSLQGAFTNERIARTETGGQQAAGVTVAALNFAPVFPKFDENGNFYRNLGTLNGQQVDNPLAIANDIYNRAYATRIFANSYADFLINENLTFRTTWGANILNNKNNFYATRQTNLGFSSNGDASISAGLNVNWLNENTFNYSKSFAQKHNFSALVGFTQQGFKNEFFTANASNFSNDFALYNNLGSGATLRAPSSGVVEWGLLSFLGRVNYGYDDRYLLTFTARTDGSSRFGPNRRYGFFPSGAFAWRIINEGFMKSQQVLSDFKLRSSYGLSGNQEIGDYQFLSSIAPVQTVFGGNLQVGGAQNRVGNFDLGWERNAQLNVGLDFGFINNRIQISTDYYRKVTSDLLITVNIPQSSGFSTSLQNIGKVENQGFEFGLNALVMDKKDFQWYSDFNISFNENKILNLDDSRREFIGGVFGNVVGYNITRVGEPLGAFYGRVVEGIFQSQEEVNNSAQPNARPGDFRFKDLNDDGVINDRDREIIGNPNPKLFGGLNNTLIYKQFELNVFIQGSYGNDILNFQKFETHNLNGQNNQSRDVLNRWTPANTNTDIPRANSQGGQRILSTFHIEDGSYLRFKNISLGYNLPSSLINKLSVKSAKVYVAGQNLITLTNYSGYDPEVNFFGSGSTNQGLDFGAYPMSKTILIGLNVKF